MEPENDYRHCRPDECEDCTGLTLTLGSCRYNSDPIKPKNDGGIVTLNSICKYDRELSPPKCTEQENYHTCPGDSPFDEPKLFLINP